MKTQTRFAAAALILVGVLGACGESSSVEFTRQRNSALCVPEDVAAAEAEVTAALEAQQTAYDALAQAESEYAALTQAFSAGEATQAEVDAGDVKLADALAAYHAATDARIAKEGALSELRAACVEQGVTTDTTPMPSDSTPVDSLPSDSTPSDSAPTDSSGSAGAQGSSERPVQTMVFPENPKVGDAVWFGASSTCNVQQWYWLASSARYEIYSGAPTHQPFVPSQPETYSIRIWGTCDSGEELERTIKVTPQAVAVPANDNFADASVIEGEAGIARGNSLGATWEEGESRHTGCFWEADVSTWHRWTAPKSGLLTFSLDSSFAVPVYLLTKATSAADVQNLETSWLPEWAGQQVEVTEGDTYYFLISGCYRQGFGSYKLNWSIDGAVPPVEDTVPAGGGSVPSTDETVPAVSDSTPAVATQVVKPTEFTVTPAVIEQTDNPNVVNAAIPDSALTITISPAFEASVLSLAGAKSGRIQVSAGYGGYVPIDDANRVVQLGPDTKELKVNVVSTDTAARELTVALVRKPVELVPVGDSGSSSNTMLTVIIAAAVVVLAGGAVAMKRRKPAGTDA
ncbi:MAG: hypothetical protein ACO36A_02765 [Ilumatobacteraceae bacterium]